MGFYRVKELPESDRPREKLLKIGPENLSDSELLAIILRTGTKGKNAIDLSRELLKHFGGIERLADVHPEELLSFKGLGKAKAVTLLAAIELGKRCILGGEKRKIRSPEDVAGYLSSRYGNLRVEVFGVITLDAKGNVLSIHEIAKGGTNFASVTPKEIFRPAIKDLADAVIFFHNHPSGNPAPSAEDLKVTKDLLRVANLLGIEVLDHVIVGRRSFFSFKKEGLLG